MGGFCEDAGFAPKTAVIALSVARDWAMCRHGESYQAFFSRCHELLYWMNHLLSTESETAGAALVIMRDNVM